MSTQPPEWFASAINTQPQTEHFTSQDTQLCKSYWHANNSNADMVILVHGTGAHRHWWDFIAPQLNGDYGVVAFDMAGMGDSEHRDSYSMADMGADICTLAKLIAQQLQPKRIVLVGHSMGGFAVLNAAKQSPDLFDQLVVVDSPVRPPDYDYSTHQSSAPIRRRKVYPDYESAMLRFRLTPYQECANDYILKYIAHHSIAQTDEGYCWKFDDEMMKKLRGRRDPHLLSESPVPVHLIYGSESALVYGAILQHMKSELPPECISEIAGAAHHVFLDKPQEFVAVLKKVLQGA